MKTDKSNLVRYAIGVVITIGVAIFSRYFLEEDKPQKIAKDAPRREKREKKDEAPEREPKEQNEKSNAGKSTESNVGELKGFSHFIPDGDTVHLKDGTKVRLVGINCPEIYHDQNLTQRCANEAKAYLSSLITNKELTIKFKENNKTDQYQRMLGDIYVGSTWVNLEMIKNGYAFVYSTSDGDISDQLFAAEKEAQQNKVGLWKIENDPNLFEKFQPKFESGDMAQYADKTILITGVVDKFSKNKGAVVLAVQLKDGSIVKASLSKKNYIHFPELKSEMFLHKNISIIGRVSTFRDKTEITIRYPTQVILK